MPISEHLFEGANVEQRVTALSDAAILYGAQRYCDGVHDDAKWPHRNQYRKEDDRALFLEFLHNLYLHDRIVLDNRPIDAAERDGWGRLSAFLDDVNDHAGDTIFVHKPLDSDFLDEQAVAGRKSTDGLPTAVQRGVCKLVADHVASGRAAELHAVTVPWAYHRPSHADYPAISKALRDLSVDASFVPFALFVWRAIWYGALARYQARTCHRPFAYIAAPRRVQALRAVLDASVLARFEYPREAVRALSFELPDAPRAGYDFTDLNFVSPFESSALAARVAESTPAEAIRLTLRERRSGHAKKVRDDWADLISGNASTSVIGTTVVQIMRDMTVHGNATQQVRLRAVPT